MSLFDDISRRIKSVSPTGAIIGSLKAAVGKYAPKYYGPASALLNGDPLGAALSYARTKFGPIQNPYLSTLFFQSMRNPLLGGITPSEAERIHAELQSTQFAKKNLFFLEILDYYPTGGGADEGGSNIFNLFAVGISISSATIGGDTKQIGSSTIDSVTGREKLEIRITTYDDARGTVKAWFKQRADAVTRPDGTFGLPSDYLVQIRILHAAINDDVMERLGGYEEKFIMRPASIETELSRTEDNLQELQLSFAQFDPFMFNGF